MQIDKKEMLIEICNHCGKDVSWGSGKFVNRVPDLNDIQTRLDNNVIYPIGDFVCAECDNNFVSQSE